MTGKNNSVIRPRAAKSREQQKFRTQNKAEEFSPAWVCNAQNNVIDDAWFGRSNVFNIEKEDNTWERTTEKIKFPEGKTWKDYVSDLRIDNAESCLKYIKTKFVRAMQGTLKVT